MIDVEDFRKNLFGEHGNIGGDAKRKVMFSAMAKLLEGNGNAVGPVYSPIQLKSGRITFAIDGYDLNLKDDCLKLISLIDCNPLDGLDGPWVENICGADDVRRVSTCLSKAFADIGALRKQLPKDSDLAEHLLDALLGNPRGEHKTRMELEIWTNGKATKALPKVIREMRLSTSVIDTENFGRMLRADPDMPEVNFEGDHGLVQVFLEDECFVDAQEGSSAQPFSVLLGKIGGNLLAELYHKHRDKLLQQNVRSFLNCTGEVNKGILGTISQNPGDFLSFNNGIAATATHVRLRRVSDGLYVLCSARDFQIVNGGQTTATLMLARWQKGLDLSRIKVAMKLTVVDLVARPDMVTQIARYANFQNKVQNADFHANKGWFSRLQAISRREEARGTARSNGHRIHWYFERTRGQYEQDRVSKGSPARSKKFSNENPKWAKFDKLDLAMVMMAWDLRPFESALGPQKCFSKFLGFFPGPPRGVHVDPRGHLADPVPDSFKSLCFLLDLWKHGSEVCKREVKNNELPYKTLAAYLLALVGKATNFQLPFGEFWATQEVPEFIKDIFPKLAVDCWNAIGRGFEKVESPSKKLSEYVKKGSCWEYVSTEIQNPFGSPTFPTSWTRFSIDQMIALASPPEPPPLPPEPPKTCLPPELRLAPDPHEVLEKLGPGDWSELANFKDMPLTQVVKSQQKLIKQLASEVGGKLAIVGNDLSFVASYLILVKKNDGCPGVLEKLGEHDWAALEEMIKG